ncbi:hypothetical protein WN51_13425 [Melipona quadrifasciata]|uniref:Uncharacterized protein n=1 Tax=Melipona quadrifasciata TaxID=166423 RepID=A0A0N0BGP6_9HYME|nr:hypothetical protein WN51_13425 [Melipona quadrifasciata]
MDKATMEKKYMTMVKMCGMLCGIWPDQSKLSKYAMRVFVYVFASTSFFTQRGSPDMAATFPDCDNRDHPQAYELYYQQ